MKFGKKLAFLALSAFAFAHAANVTVSSRDEAISDPQWSKPRIFIKNDGTESLQIFKIRYYFMVEAGKDPRIEIWDPSNLSATIVQDQNGLAYAEVNLGGATLAPGESYRWGNGMQFGLHYNDWSTFDKSNDWSEPSVPSGSAPNSHIVLLGAFDELITGISPNAGVSSSSGSGAVLEVSITEESSELAWSKPRIRLRNISNNNVTVGDVIYSVTGDPVHRPEVQVFDPYGTAYRIDSLGQGQWVIHLQLQTILTAGQSFNWGNGISFGIHNTDWSLWNHSDDVGLIAVLDPAGNQLLGSYTAPSSSSTSYSSSSLLQSSSSSLMSSSSQYVSSSSLTSSSSSRPSSSSQYSSSSQPSSSSYSSSSSVTGVVLASWPFPIRRDTVPVLGVAPKAIPRDARPVSARYSFLLDPRTGIQQVPDTSIFTSIPSHILRGRVLDGDGDVLPGAKVWVAAHPEWGFTRSRADGWFDLMVGILPGTVVSYSKADYLSAQRKVPDLIGSDFQAMPDVALVTLSPVAWRVNLSQISGIAPLPGETIQDADGARQSVLLVPQGTTATLSTSSGTTTLSNITVRQTEYTVGAMGMARMPASLPLLSAYTYALDFSVDEAILAGGGSVQFSKPIANYTDNFLGFPVGTVIPVGSYNSTQSKWISELDGITLGIIGSSGDVALIDVDGDNQADNWNGRATTMLGITQEELRWLKQTYPVGKTLWRTVVTHFSPWDYNHPYAPEDSAVAPPPPAPVDSAVDSVPGEEKDPCESGSAIDVFGCTVSESWQIPGSSLSLVHASVNTTGFAPNRTLSIALKPKGSSVQPRSILVQIEVAGQVHVDTINGSQDAYSFVWDGNDAYGRPVNGYVQARVTLGYEWNLRYVATVADFNSAWNKQSFGVSNTTGQRIASSRGSNKYVMENTTLYRMYSGEESQFGLPVWTLEGQETFHSNVGIRRDALGNAKSLPVTSMLRSRVRQVNTSSCGGIICYTVDPIQWASGGLTDNVVLTHNGTNTEAFHIAGGYFTWQFWGGASVSAHILGMDKKEYYVINNGLYLKSGSTMITQVQVGTGNKLFAVDGQSRVFWMAGTVLHMKDASGDHVLSLSGLSGSVVDIAALPNGTVVLATATTVYTGSQPASGSIKPLSIAHAGETFTSVAADLGGRIFVAVHSGSGSKILALTNAGGQVSLAGGGSSFTSINWSSGRDAHFDGELIVRANESGQLSYLEKLQSGNLAGWVDSIPMGQFQEPGSGILDSANTVVLISDSLGRHVWSISAMSGDTLLGFRYDSLGRTTQVREGRKGYLSFDWSVSGQVQLVAPTGEVSQLDLNGNGLPIRLTRDADGATYQATYATGNLLESWENPVGSETRFDYDADGKIKVDHNARGGSKTILRGGNKDTIAVGVRTATGKETWYDRYRDSLGLWVRRVKSTYGGLELTNTSVDGNIDSTWNEDSTLVVHRKRSRQGLGSDSTYNIQILPSGATLIRKGSSEVGYGLKDSLPIIAYTRDTIDLGGNKTIATYDRSSGIMQVQSPEGRKTILGLDSLGRIRSRWLAGRDTVYYSYNQNGQIVQTGSNGRQSKFEYGTDQRLQASIDALGHRTDLQRDASGRVVQGTFSDGSHVGFQYDLADRLQSLELGLGNTHTFAYEPTDAESLWVAPNIGGASEFSEAITRDLDGKVVSVRHPDGTVTMYQYDAGMRLSRRISIGDTLSFTWAGSTKRKASEIRTDTAAHSDTIAYAWDGSRLLSAESKGFAAGNVSFVYDSLWRVSGVNAGTQTTNYTYDRDGLPLTAGMLSIGRDVASGREISTQIGVVTTSTTYQGSRIATRTSVANGQIIRKWEYTYDALDRISEIRETDKTGAVTISDYAYGNGGRLAQVKKNGSVVESYAYDSQGNRTTFTSSALGSGTASFDARDRILSQGNTSYGWDANGALTQTTNSTSLNRYIYDQRGNLLKATLANGKVVEYQIDARDRRIGKLVDGVPQEGFLYKDQLEPIAWTNGNGGIKATFVYDDNVNVPSYMVISGVNYRIVTDHLGSVRMVINATTGAVAQEMDYDAFGNVVRNTNPGFQPFGFAGGIDDQHTGLVRFGARDYDPMSGRWTSIDPIRFKGGLNLYAYVGNDPVNKIDPDGLAEKKICDFNKTWKNKVCEEILSTVGRISPPAECLAEYGLCMTNAGSTEEITMCEANRIACNIAPNLTLVNPASSGSNTTLLDQGAAELRKAGESNDSCYWKNLQ